MRERPNILYVCLRDCMHIFMCASACVGEQSCELPGWFVRVCWCMRRWACRETNLVILGEQDKKVFHMRVCWSFSAEQSGGPTVPWLTAK